MKLTHGTAELAIGGDPAPDPDQFGRVTPGSTRRLRRWLNTVGIAR